MTQKRKRYPDPDQVAILKRHLVEKMPLSELCDEYGIHPTMFYRWQKQLFENGAAAFAKADKPSKATEEAKDRRIAALEEKLQQKNEVLAELMQEYVQLKKERGEP